MLKGLLRTPRPPEPLPAVLAGAGFFLFMAALTGLGPFQALDRTFWEAASPGEARPASQAAVRVLGRSNALSGPAQVSALAEDILWLRQAGAGAIVVEAWLDEAPQAEARKLADALFERFQFLGPKAKAEALAALSETAAQLDAAPRLADALNRAQPLLLAWQAVPGRGAPPPPALERQGYEVTLRGERQSLPEMQAVHVPWDEALLAAPRSGACASIGEDGRVPAVVEMGGRWYNALGLEAARMALGLPIEAMRYRWRKGSLSSLELKGVRYPLDDKGRLLLSGGIAELPSLDIARLKADPELRRHLQGRAVFFRPWPRQLGDAAVFDEQGALFSALVERGVLAPPASARSRMAWVLGWGLGIAALIWLPAWLAVLGWAVLPLWALQSFAQEPQGLAVPLSLALSSLLMGLAWRLDRWRRRQAEAGLPLLGRVAPRQRAAWESRLQGGKAGLEAAYAMVGPRGALRGPDWEAWVGRWGPFLDHDLALDGLGLVFPGPDASRLALQALEELRGLREGLRCALGFGMLAFDSRKTMGAVDWRLEGPGKDRCFGLFSLARPGQVLVLENDYESIRNQVQIQLTGQTLNIQGEDQNQVLNILVLKGKM